MQAPYPYQILHVPLEHPLSLPTPEQEEGGLYLVFWWKSVPLGHLYLEPGLGLSLAQYQEKVVNAIKPTLAFYAGQNTEENQAWLEMNLGKHQEGLISYLGRALKNQDPEDLPTQVPVSVVICTCNRPQQLQQCLERFTHLLCLPQEILVIDNAPRDEATKEVVQQFAGVRYIREARVGLDVARNTGARQAQYPVVAFVDDDVTIHALWVYRVWETFQNPQVAAMTGLIMAAELQSEAQCIFEKHWSFNRGYLDKMFEADFFQATFQKGPPVWKIGAGANMAFRKSVFEEVGYFDEMLDAGAAGCNGDSEMWYRLLANGKAIHYNPRAIVFHTHRQEVEELKRQIFHYMRGHTVAALLQRQQHRAGYLKYLLKLFLISYSRSAIKGFPTYTFQYRTLWSQVTGVVAGFSFYIKHRSRRRQISVK
jgi:GT2 family glycosyltransferase